LGDAEVADICKFRALVECEALADAMENRRDALIDGLQACLDDMARAFSKEQTGEFPRLDTEFHNAIVDHCANSYLKSAYAMVAAQITALRYRLPEENSQVTHCQDNHDILLQAIRAGDHKRAQRMLRDHIHSTQNAYLIASRKLLVGRADRAAA
jgi:DNA-binding GntR family transcriptional regulator